MVIGKGDYLMDKHLHFVIKNMKKLTYIAAALIALAGCSKNEATHDKTGASENINLSLKVNSWVPKAAFDGKDHINFVENDKFYAAIAKTDNPTRAIPVATTDQREASKYYSTFKLADATAEEPTFTGTFYSITEANKADEYCLYGVFPSDALFTSYLTTDDTDGDLLTNWIVTLPEDQSAATQSSWAPKANVMVLKPTTIKYNESAKYEYASGNEYNSTNENESVEFAHLFGYGKINFAGVPAEYEDCVVKSVTIKAVGDDKVIAGRFYVDVTKEVGDYELTPYTKKDAITLKGDGETTIKDYVAWFAAKPGTFDVDITVTTTRAILTFETRHGLEISAGHIAAPTVNYKETDKYDNLDVAIAEGSSWSMSKFSYSLCITTDSKAWGDTGMDEMNFSLTFPNKEKDAAGSYISSSGTYKQKLATQKVKKIVLASDAYFSGMKAVKMNLGINTADVTADFTVSVVKGAKTVELGKVTVAGNASNIDGQNYYFNTTEESETGSLVLTVDNFSTDEKYCIPYLGAIVINPAPEIVLSETALKVEKTAGTTSIDCTVKAATGDPTVSVAEDAASWLTATYAEGKINVTVTENTGAKRIGTITVKATGFSESTATITVTQASATAVEYTLTVTASDVKKAIEDALDGDTATDSYIPLTATFNAESADGKTFAVPVTFTYINYATATDEYFTVSTQSYSKQSEIKCTSSTGAISKFVVVADYYSKASSWAECCMQLSTDGKTWSNTSAEYVKGDDGYYTSTVLNEDETKTWFNIKTPDWVKYLKVKSFEVTFVVD